MKSSVNDMGFERVGVSRRSVRRSVRSVGCWSDMMIGGFGGCGLVEGMGGMLGVVVCGGLEWRYE